MPSPSRRRRKSPSTARVADRFHSAAIHLLRRLRRVDEASGLSGPKLSALSVLVFGGPKRLGELARAEQVRPPSMTRLVQDLEAQGLVTRKGDRADRRAVHIRATAKGARLLKQGRSRRVAMLAEWLGGLERSDLSRLERGVEIIERLSHRDARD